MKKGGKPTGSLAMSRPDTSKKSVPVNVKSQVIKGGQKFAGKMFSGPDLSGGGHVK